MSAGFHRALGLLLAMSLAAPLPVSAQETDFGELVPLIPTRYQPPDADTEGGLWLALDRVEGEIRRSAARINNVALETYLQEIVCRLSQEYCPDFRIYILRKPYFNAAMAPNGMMMVWSGLLLRVRNEAQLASVLGHEMGHYLRRHSLQQFEDYKNKSTFMAFLSLGLAGAAAAGGIDPGVGRAAGDLAGIGILASIFSFSREHEREADLYGAQLLHKARYDMSQSARVWSQLIEEEEAADIDTHRLPGFFASHPPPDDREASLRAYAEHQQQDDAGAYLGDEAFRQQMRPFIEQWCEDQILLNQPGRSRHLFASLRSDSAWPEMMSYYLGEVHRRDAQEPGEYEQALRAYGRALDGTDPVLKAHRQQGMVYLKMKDKPNAHQAFLRYLDAVPDAEDKAMIDYYLEITQ